MECPRVSKNIKYKRIPHSEQCIIYDKITDQEYEITVTQADFMRQLNGNRDLESISSALSSKERQEFIRG